MRINAHLDAEVRELTKDRDEEKTRVNAEVADRKKRRRDIKLQMSDSRYRLVFVRMCLTFELLINGRSCGKPRPFKAEHRIPS